MSTGSQSGLSLVHAPKRRAIEREDFVQPSLQGVLFPITKRNLAVLVRFPDVTDEEFKSVLEFARPRIVADFRSVPTFSIGRLNRRLVFDALKKDEVAYLDVAMSADDGRQPELEQKMNIVTSMQLPTLTWRCLQMTEVSPTSNKRVPSCSWKLGRHRMARWY